MKKADHSSMRRPIKRYAPELEGTEGPKMRKTIKATNAPRKLKRSAGGNETINQPKSRGRPVKRTLETTEVENLDEIRVASPTPSCTSTKSPSVDRFNYDKPPH